MITPPVSFPSRPNDGHKGTFGTVIILGGCKTMPGAPALAARAALRTGVGKVAIATTADTLPITLGFNPSVMGIEIPADAQKALIAIHEFDPQKRAVLMVGPGWGQQKWQKDLIGLLRRCNRPLLLDADGLNLLATKEARQFTCPTVLTPHPGEMARLLSGILSKEQAKLAELIALENLQDHELRAAEALHLAQCTNASVLYKGHESIVINSQGNDMWCTPFGNNSTLAIAGSGDVLSGCIASLMAQGLAPYNAAKLGAWLHGYAGQLAQEQSPVGILAEELADLLALALAHGYSKEKPVQ